MESIYRVMVHIEKPVASSLYRMWFVYVGVLCPVLFAEFFDFSMWCVPLYVFVWCIYMRCVVCMRCVLLAILHVTI